MRWLPNNGSELTDELVAAYQLEGYDTTPSNLGRSFLFEEAGLIWTDDDNALGMYLTPGADPTSYTRTYLMTRILKRTGYTATQTFDRLTNA
ncbi:hypothetical protein R4P47_23080 [Rhodococcus sp. IEGM 1370]|uniref:hypothetical protein n=1 Tax=Rhodococcus sp. IEGM 1370 TaxID=3082222 RepID=UPI0029537FC1|nr:hypothetical protein [Rhodococcus sp. IEGM 1370]MDV8079458.1 hypothetical protein [Rhodococcus sp. IEGM 1370]